LVGSLSIVIIARLRVEILSAFLRMKLVQCWPVANKPPFPAILAEPNLVQFSAGREAKQSGDDCGFVNCDGQSGIVDFDYRPASARAYRAEVPRPSFQSVMERGNVSVAREEFVECVVTAPEPVPNLIPLCEKPRPRFSERVKSLP